jgi:NAD(P)-dependent dehydrogenase (short-subunit alcohol dehydrogenase family)
MGSLQGKVALITGGGSGIGRATARLFASKGAKVVVADLDERGGQETVEQVKGSGGQALFVKGDVASPVGVQEIVGRTLSAFGGVHVLHNNAAVLRSHPAIEDVPVDEWRWVIDVDLTGLFLAARAVAPVMKAQGGGVIINMSSMAGLTSYAQGLAYASAKAGVLGLTRSLALLLEPHRIRVNAICPSGVDTPILKHTARPVVEGMARSGLLQPEDIARAVEYLATADGVTGATVMVHLEHGRASYYKLKPFEGEPIAELA